MIVAKVLEILGIGIYGFLLLRFVDGGSVPLKNAIAARKWRSVVANRPRYRRSRLDLACPSLLRP